MVKPSNRGHSLLPLSFWGRSEFAFFFSGLIDLFNFGQWVIERGGVAGNENGVSVRLKNVAFNDMSAFEHQGVGESGERIQENRKPADDRFCFHSYPKPPSIFLLLILLGSPKSIANIGIYKNPQPCVAIRLRQDMSLSLMAGTGKMTSLFTKAAEAEAKGEKA